VLFLLQYVEVRKRRAHRGTNATSGDVVTAPGRAEQHGRDHGQRTSA